MNTDLHALSAANALDALDADERTEFEAHLSGCESCGHEIEEFTFVAEGLAVAASATPPAHLRDAVMSQIGAVEQEPPPDAPPAEAPQAEAPVIDLAARRRRKNSIAALLSAAAAVALLAIGAIVISGTRGGSGFDDVVAAPDAEVVELIGESGTVEVVWSPERDQVALRGSGLAVLDPTLRYALWAIADGTPIPAGLFETDDGTIRDIADLDIDVAEAWGITIEPATGSDAPTTEIIYFAEV